MSTHVTRRGRRLPARVAAGLAALGSAVAVGVLHPGAAAADPPEPGNASCMGYEGSAVSPPGTEDEALGGMPDVLAQVDEFFVAPNGNFRNRGELVSFFTKLGADSHEGCDEALIEAVFGGG